MKYNIGELAVIIDGDRGKNYPKQNEFYENEYCLFLDASNVTSDGFVFESTHFITKEKDELLRNGRLQRGDIVYTTRGTVGNAAYYCDSVPYDAVRINSGMVILRCKRDLVDEIFLYHVLKSDYYRPYFKSFCTGSAQPQLPIRNFSKIEMEVPSLNIQHRIGSILSAYDNLIKNNQKQIKLLEEVAHRLYKEWFIDLRFPGYEDTEIIDGVPEGWKKQRISSLGEIITGKTPSTANEQYYGGNIPFVKIPDMHNCVYPIKTEVTLTAEGANTQKNKFIPKDSIMISCIATVGLVNIAVEPCQTNQQINSIIVNKEQDLYYVYSTMKRLKELLEGVGSNGATMTNVNKTKFGNLEVFYPTEELRKRYFEFCEPLFKKILTLSVSNRKLSQARDRLLPKLMSGELEV